MKMTIAEQVMASQDVKEMTRRAIRILIAIDPDGEATKGLIREFEAGYGEPV